MTKNLRIAFVIAMAAAIAFISIGIKNGGYDKLSSYSITAGLIFTTTFLYMFISPFFNSKPE